MTVQTTPALTTTTASPTTPNASRRRRVLAVALVAVVAAIAGGAELGRHLAGTAPAVAPSSIVPVNFPQDWQAYRSGERGTLPYQPKQQDWLSYRAGEH